MIKDVSYKFPLFLAILLHVGILAFLLIEFAAPALQLSGESSVHIINASLVKDSKAKQVKPIMAAPKPILSKPPVIKPVNNQQEQQKLAEQQAIQKQKAQEMAQKAAQEKATQKAAAIKAAEDKAAALKLAQEQAKEAALLKKQQATLAAKKAAQQKQKELAQQIKAEQQRLLQQQMATEQKQLNNATETAAAAAAHQKQLQSEIDKYKALVIQAISQNWLVPDGADKSLSCQLLVKVAPGGTVLGVQVLKPSGNDALDNSATTAVLKSSPLPVPADPELFDKFRELRLTVRPESIVSN